MRTFLIGLSLVLCSCAGDPTPAGPPSLQPTIPADAASLADLSNLTGLLPLSADQLSAKVHEVGLFEQSGHIKAAIRGVLVNRTDRVLTDGELRVEATVDFDDGCPQTIHGSKGLGSLKVSEANPWRPGEERTFTVTSDEHLPSITGEFAAARVQWRLEAFVEDPLCWRSKGTVAELSGNWASATVGSEASGLATTNTKVALTTAFDGGDRVETLEEGTAVTVVGVRGRKLRVKAPSGVEGWAKSSTMDLADAGALWP